jgi:hypothetical protein
MNNIPGGGSTLPFISSQRAGQATVSEFSPQLLSVPRHRAAFGHIEPFPATEGPAAEVPAGGRALVVDGAPPCFYSAAIRCVFPQVLTRYVGKKVTFRFLKPPLAEVMQLVGFALLYKNKGQPAAAFAATAARS